MFPRRTFHLSPRVWCEFVAPECGFQRTVGFPDKRKRSSSPQETLRKVPLKTRLVVPFFVLVGAHQVYALVLDLVGPVTAAFQAQHFIFGHTQQDLRTCSRCVTRHRFLQSRELDSSCSHDWSLRICFDGLLLHLDEHELNDPHASYRGHLSWTARRESTFQFPF